MFSGLTSAERRYSVMNKKIIYILLSLILLEANFGAFAADKSICSYDAYLTLYNDGTLKSCTLKDRYDINGITCKGNVSITFHNSGALQSCQLNENVTIDDNKCKADGLITYYPDGKLNQCVKSED
jgi:hypothetical protein